MNIYKNERGKVFIKKTLGFFFDIIDRLRLFQKLIRIIELSICEIMLRMQDYLKSDIVV